MSSATAPRRARPSAAETRRRLLAAGRTAFARKGLDGTNLRDDILAPAGVSVGSFYHQFRDKTELLLAILLEDSAAFRARLHQIHTPAPGRTFADIARASYAFVFDLAEQHADLMRLRRRESESGGRGGGEYGEAGVGAGHRRRGHDGGDALA